MVLNLLLVAGAIVAIVALGWWIRRRQRDIDSYEEREYREPPAIHIPPGGPRAVRSFRTGLSHLGARRPR